MSSHIHAQLWVCDQQGGSIINALIPPCASRACFPCMMPSTNNFQWSDFWQNHLNGAVKVCDLPIFSKEGSPPESYARRNRKPPELRCTRLPKDQEAYSPNSVQDCRTWTDLQAEDRLLQYFVKAYSPRVRTQRRCHRNGRDNWRHRWRHMHSHLRRERQPG